MVQWFDDISDDHAEWIRKQKVFFVATAPLDGRGTVNCSPKGHDSLRVLNRNQICYLELSGSGIETQSHLEENGRITVMLMAMEGGPRIMRLLGTGRVVRVDSTEYNQLMEQHFVDSDICNASGKRGIIMIDVRKVGTSCGYAVPYYDYRGQRETLVKAFSTRDEETVKRYWLTKNKFSLDGLPGMRHAILGPEWTGKNRGPGEAIVLPQSSALSESTVKKFTTWITSGTGLANVSILTAGIIIGAALSPYASGRRR
ncbi:hypothetical protein BGX28_001453 [Mortierella sp. GBA30]|nr:hypothetical protein BGX28_001453 [Mortierella sp. GBA30]